MLRIDYKKYRGDILMNTEEIEACLKAVEIFGEKFTKFIEKKYKNKKEKDAIIYGYAWDKYLKQSSQSLSTFRSILDGKARNIYDTYQCIGLTNGEEEYNCNITDLAKLSNRIIVTGIGGIGKTTMMKHLFLDARNQGLIPIYIELRQINDIDIDNNNSIIDIIYSNIEMYGFDLNKEVFQDTLEYGNYIFLFDAYDEVKSEKLNFINKSLKCLSNRYEKNTYIVTSRPNDEFNSWGNFLKLKSIPLNKEQAIFLVRKLDYGDKIFQDEFCEKLEKSLFNKYKSFASNPLLLTIMLMTYEDSGFIPENINDFYEQAFLTLFSKHDRRKGGNYTREYRSELSYTEFKKLFSKFCANTFKKRKFSFKESEILSDIENVIKNSEFKLKCNSENFKYDIENSMCMIIKDGLNYKFIHRTFQEYFAAYYISKELVDEKQKLIIREMIDKSRSDGLENFLSMLNLISNKKFEKNVLYTYFCEFKKYRKENIDYINIIKDTIFDVSRTQINDEFVTFFRLKNNGNDIVWKLYKKFFKKEDERSKEKDILIAMEINNYIEIYENYRKLLVENFILDGKLELLQRYIEFTNDDIDKIFRFIDEFEVKIQNIEVKDDEII